MMPTSLPPSKQQTVLFTSSTRSSYPQRTDRLFSCTHKPDQVRFVGTIYQSTHMAIRLLSEHSAQETLTNQRNWRTALGWWVVAGAMVGNGFLVYSPVFYPDRNRSGCGVDRSEVRHLHTLFRRRHAGAINGPLDWRTGLVASSVSFFIDKY